MQLSSKDSGVKVSEWVRQNRLRIKYTQAMLAIAAELGEATISLIERGERDGDQLTDLTMEKLQTAFGVPFPTLLPRHFETTLSGSRAIGARRAGPEPRRIPMNELGNATNAAIGERHPPGDLSDDIPLLANIRAGIPDGGIYDGTIDCLLPVRGMYGLSDPQAFALQVVGDSMAPRMPAGTVVYIAPNEKRLDGEPCFVQFGAKRDYMATIKNVFDAGADWLLIANNPNHHPNTDRVSKTHVSRVLPVVRYSVPTR